MRTIKYLSPSSVGLFLKEGADAFYMRYLADGRPPLEPQLQVMSVGSAFDAYAKSYLYQKLFGHDEGGKFGFENLFESQVEVQNRDWALEAGKRVFDAYRTSGAMADLMLELSDSSCVPRFEISIEKEFGGVRLLGKPDAIFCNKFGTIVLDWKVNGYMSKSGASPKPGYVRLWDSGHHSMHKKCLPVMYRGVMINSGIGGGNGLGNDADWERQLTIYGWLSGEGDKLNGVGEGDTKLGGDTKDQIVVGIDQLCCSGLKDSNAKIRVANHRSYVPISKQVELFVTIQDLWDRIHSGWFFRDLPFEDSIVKSKRLDASEQIMVDSGMADFRFVFK